MRALGAAVSPSVLSTPGLDAGRDDAQFLRWFDLMGVQRHLKVGGIFARLWHRDGKPGYLAGHSAHAQYVEDTSCAAASTTSPQLGDAACDEHVCRQRSAPSPGSRRA